MKTFKQLLDVTYKGPFEIDEQDDGVFIGAPDAEPMCKMFHQFADPDTPRENAELVARLLNFAHAGGVEALSQLLNNADDRGETKNEETGDDFPDWAAIRQALAILNGEATP
jgi:hypothetical protein